MDLERLLAEISDISQKYNLVNQKTGGNFNIFQITNIDSDEVRICRVLYELLNPKGSHYQGCTYLKLFIENVLSKDVLHFNLDFDESEYKSAQVFREYAINGGRRIDIVIKIADKFIPIEVKVSNEEQASQCCDYYKEANNSNLFYLTPYGTPPSEYSAHGLTIEEDGYKEVTQISFEQDIIFWLEKCLEDQDTIKISPIREVLIQFISVIRRLTNQMEENQKMEIVEKLSSSKAAMKSAFEIEKSLKTCKTEMIKKILSAIEGRINKKKLLNQYDYKNDTYKLVNSYYDKRAPSYPGISYFCKSLNKPGVDLWFRIEFEDRLFVGFCTPLNDKCCLNQLDSDEIKALLPDLEPCVDNWWIYSHRLPKDDEAVSPDFKNFDETYFNLFDKEKFDAFIDKSMENIGKLWSTTIK